MGTWHRTGHVALSTAQRTQHEALSTGIMSVPSFPKGPIQMGDAGEGLIDADARIQERMEELALSRAKGRKQAVKNPEQLRQLESLKLARAAAARQLVATTHEQRKTQLNAALKDLDKQIKTAQAAVDA